MRARSVLPILVLSLVLPFADPARAETDAANGGTIRVSANYHPGGANDAERRAIAETHDLVVLGTGFGDVGPPSIYYQVNPSIIAIEYQSWFDTGAGSIDWAELNQHEDWFYHDAQGRRIATYDTLKTLEGKQETQ